MDFFDRPHYRLNKRLLFFVGLWPLQTENQRYFYRTTTILIVASIFVPELIKFVECLGDLNATIECFLVVGIHFRSFVRLINSSVKASTVRQFLLDTQYHRQSIKPVDTELMLTKLQMRKLTTRIKDDWTMRTGEFDEAILRCYAEKGRRFTVVYVVYIYVSLGIYLSLPLIPIVLDVVAPSNESRDKVYFFQSEFFVDEEKRYFYILIHAYVAMPIALSVIIACDSMFAVHVQHTCGIFASLGARLKSIGGIAKNNKVKIYNDEAKRTDEAYDDIVECIKMHAEAVEITKLIESSGYISLIFVVGASVLTITVTGFMTVMNLDQPSEALRFGICAIGDLIHLCYLCWQGHVLMEHSEDIFINAYKVDWYDMSPRAKKLLILIMLRSFEPCKLSAGKIFVLSMENYAAAVKTTMSYFTVLLTMQ